MEFGSFDGKDGDKHSGVDFVEIYLLLLLLLLLLLRVGRCNVRFPNRQGFMLLTYHMTLTFTLLTYFLTYADLN